VVKVIITYNLRPGADRGAYKDWSRRVDQQIAARQPGVRSYAIYEVVGTSTDNVTCQFVEDIEADSREAWERVNTYEEMKPVVEEWLRYCDPNSVQVVYCEKV